MRKIRSLKKVTNEDEGSYIRVDGYGILNGLQGEAVKRECYKIVEVVEATKDTTACLHIRRYKWRHDGHIRQVYFQQRAELYTPVEFKKLSITWSTK